MSIIPHQGWSAIYISSALILWDQSMHTCEESLRSHIRIHCGQYSLCLTDDSDDDVYRTSQCENAAEAPACRCRGRCGWEGRQAGRQQIVQGSEPDSYTLANMARHSGTTRWDLQ